MTIQSSFRKDEKYSGEWDRKPYFICILREINRVHTSHMYHTVTHKFVQFNNNKKAKTTGLENYNRDVLTFTFNSRMAICTAVLFYVESPGNRAPCFSTLPCIFGGRQNTYGVLWFPPVSTHSPMPVWSGNLVTSPRCCSPGEDVLLPHRQLCHAESLSDSLAASTVLDVMGGVMVSFMHQPG